MSMIDTVVAGLRRATSGQLDLSNVRDFLTQSRGGTSAVSVAESDHCGWVHKQGSFVKNWKRRFMVLHDDTLHYYKTDVLTSEARPRGSFRVTAIQSAPSRRHGLIVDGTGTRRLTFVLSDAETCEAWHEAISAALLQCRTRLPHTQSLPVTPTTKPRQLHKAASESLGASLGQFALRAAAHTNLKTVASAANTISPELGEAVTQAAPVLKVGQALLKDYEKKQAKGRRTARRKGKSKENDEDDSTEAPEEDAGDDGDEDASEASDSYDSEVDIKGIMP
ncbi:hypothetical protein ACHHYP_13554 [Achlya hypogyna]|uniref:PH domain-containing protein n=1 Tax=Achlya hypogyna TaxID=1202772 RepID=A0A1V9YF15_ACHHY|nr:hypothetical protein ACHHYP_13554 [Achlya hypogyna]